MSSRRLRTGGGPKFPTPWSEWSWNAVWKCEYRYRQLTATGNDSDIEYEYRDAQIPRDQNTLPGDQNTLPRDQNTIPIYSNVLSTSAEPSYTQQPYTPSHYTFGVHNAVQQFGRLNLDEGNTSSSTPGQSASASTTTTGTPQSSNLPQTPSAALSRPIHSRDPATDTELDPMFRVHQNWEFKFGRVFKVLWTEPAGTTGTVITNIVRKSKHGEFAYHSIRRFLIVDPREGHSLCLPILTYGGQGTFKRGVHAADHAVIYTGKMPVTNRKEKITKKPIRMDPIDARHKLDSASRINYAKVYTVEHNVKVNFIGAIARKHEQQVVSDYNATHRPLADRPYYAGGSDESAFGHAAGPEPTYSSPDIPAASWSAMASPSYPTPQSYHGQALSPQQKPSYYPSRYTNSHTAYGLRKSYNPTYTPNPTYPANSAYSAYSAPAPVVEPEPRSEYRGGGEERSDGVSSSTFTTNDTHSSEDTTTHYEEDLYDADY